MRFLRFAALPVLLTPGILLLSLPFLAAEGEGEPVAAGVYAGHESCRPCHTDLYDAWAASAHAHSTRKATPDVLPAAMREGKPVVHAPGTSSFSREGDRVLVETIGPDGQPGKWPVTHIIGPERMSFFLTRMDDGRLQVLPSMHDIATDTWFDYSHLIFGVSTDWDTPPIIRPGEPSFWTGPIRSYDRTCGRCHTSGRRVETTLEDGTPRREWDPLEIDCEACHGPSADHVAFWRDPPDSYEKDPIVALDRIGRERAQAVCLWCHMEAEVVSEHFRPGDDVFEFLTPTLLDRRERIDPAGRPLELIYDGLPFLFSRCAEEGGLTCLTCHDAHGSMHKADLLTPAEETFTLCTGCHLDITAAPKAHTHHDMEKSGGRCVSCHMPFLKIERGHGIVRDHTIGSPLPNLEGDRVAMDACTWCHTGARGAPDDSPILEKKAIREAYERWYPDAKLTPDWVGAMAGGRTGVESAFYPLVGIAGDEDLPKLVRASAAKLLDRYPGRNLPYLVNLLDDDDSMVRRAAAAALGSSTDPDSDQALLMALDDPSLAVRGEAARAALSGWYRVQRNRALLDAALPVLEEEAKAVPQEDSRWFRLGAARQIAGDVKGAIEAYEMKLTLNPYARLVEKTLADLRRQLEED